MKHEGVRPETLLILSEDEPTMDRPDQDSARTGGSKEDSTMALNNYRVGAVVAVSDMELARDFYEKSLVSRRTAMILTAAARTGATTRTTIHVFPAPPDTGKSHATVGWYVSDIEAVVDDLTANGVSFERYDQPPIATDAKGIAVLGSSKGAWFKDADGNTLGLLQD